MVSALYWLETWILHLWKTQLLPGIENFHLWRQRVVPNLCKKFGFRRFGPFNRPRQFGPPPWVPRFMDWLRDALLDAMVIGSAALVLTLGIWFMLFGG